MSWQHILAVIAIILLVGWLFRYITQNRSAFSAENLNKSFLTLGGLALVLIAIVSVLVLISRS
jgi:Na+-transporting NADH:ubiquinone oxidoreductase subunit NqrB